MRERLLLWSLHLPLQLSLSAHVGSPDVITRVMLALPFFVTGACASGDSGVAEIQIRCAAKDVRAIQIVPMRLSGLAPNYPPTARPRRAIEGGPPVFLRAVFG